MRVIRWSGLVALSGLALALGVPSAAAQSKTTVVPYVINLQKGVGGDTDINGGAGIEHPDVAYIEKDGRHYLVSVYMSSDVEQGYWQCKCSSVELTATGPKVLANGVQLTFNENAYRPCNHPRIASDKDYLVWMYASDVADTATTQTYAGVLNEMCGQEVDPRRVSNDTDDDAGAPDIASNGEGRFTGAYLYAGNGGQTRVVGIEVAPNPETLELELKTTYTSSVVSPANIGRPSVAASETDRAFVCAAEGNQRPPEEGVRCAWINTINGDVMESELILEAKPNDGIFYNQVTVSPLEFGRFSVQVAESTGVGRKGKEDGEEKGPIKSHMYIYEPSDDAITRKAQETDMELTYGTHASHCTGTYGTNDRVHMAVMGAPMSGAGQARMQMASWSTETSFVLDREKNDWITSGFADAGSLSNLYGPDPEQKGREYLRCIGGVPNPGFDESGTATDNFMPQVETLFVMPVTGKKPSEPKNALFLSLIPGASSVELTAPDFAPNDPDAEIDDGDKDTDPIAPVGPGEQADGCAVVALGSRSSHRDTGGAAAALLGILGMGVVIARRRRDSGSAADAAFGKK